MLKNGRLVNVWGKIAKTSKKTPGIWRKKVGIKFASAM